MVVVAFGAAGVLAGAGVLVVDEEPESDDPVDGLEEDPESELVLLAGALESDVDFLESRESLR